MKAVLLCAGYGTRLYPLTKDQPKALLTVGGEVLLSYLVRKLDRLHALEEIVVVSNGLFYGHFAKWLKQAKSDRPIHVINDGTQDPGRHLGAIRDLKLALDHAGSRHDVLLLAGDNFFDAPLASFVAFAQEKVPASSVGAYDVQDRVQAKKYGLILPDSSGRIARFFEKPEDPPTTLASMGIYYLPENALPYVDRYLEMNRDPDAPGYFIGWLAGEMEVFVYRFGGAWFDIGDLSSYHEADQYHEIRQRSRRA